MKTLTEQFEEILKKHSCFIKSDLMREGLRNEFVQAVKERDAYCLGEDEDGDKSMASTEWIFGHHDRGVKVKKRQEETL